VTITLVDFHGRPVAEADRLNHNERVTNGAPYSELLTLDEMTQRYKLVGPKRVQDVTTSHIWNWSAFVALYQGSMTKVDGKNIPVTTLFYQVQQDKLLTFEKLAVAEPALNGLLEQAKSFKGCAVATWYGPGGLRGQMTKLVGWGRQEGPSALQSRVAYDLVYRKLWNSLPDCREGCTCGA
jgi:hypothetical protein